MGAWDELDRNAERDAGSCAASMNINLDELTRNCFQSGFSAPKVCLLNYPL